jgi:hypothetical protein
VNEDNELKRMFKAQRKVDERLAPSFADIQAKSQAARDCTAGPAGRQSRSVVVVAAMTLTVVGLVSWINTPRPDEPDVSSASQADLQKLNQVCDSLLVRIKELDPETMTKAGTVEQAMDWPTGTDSLIPFETLIFNVRTSP